MPHVPDLRSHASHDPGLIAAYAAGDTTGEDLARATELVDACPACADLAADLRAIAAALPATALPRRRRDFRLDPATAARHRRAGWRRLLAPLGGPRFAFAAPLGTGLAALGLAGLLLGSLPGILPGGGTAGTSAGLRDAGDTGPAGAPDIQGGEAAPTTPPEAAFGAAQDLRGSGVPAPTDGRATPDAAGRNAGALLAAGSIAVLAAGLVLVGLRLSGRRLARGP